LKFLSTRSCPHLADASLSRRIQAAANPRVGGVQGLFALYQNITNIRWDAEAPNVKGFVIPDEAEERCEPRVIDLPGKPPAAFPPPQLVAGSGAWFSC
jgi:hypothetical protein